MDDADDEGDDTMVTILVPLAMVLLMVLLCMYERHCNRKKKNYLAETPTVDDKNKSFVAESTSTPEIETYHSPNDVLDDTKTKKVFSRHSYSHPWMAEDRFTDVALSMPSPISTPEELMGRRTEMQSEGRVVIMTSGTYPF